MPIRRARRLAILTDPSHTMAHPQSTDLDRFFALSSSVLPALAGECSSCDDGCIRAGRDNQAIIQTLYDNLSIASPEAGMPYWSVRCWSLMVWQPVVLTLIGVHGAGQLPPLEELRQKVGREMVAGFRLPQGRWEGGNQAELIQRGGEALRWLVDALLAELQQITRIKPLTARRLVADSLMAGVGRLGGLLPEVSRGDQLALADAWLAATGLENQSALKPVCLPDGTESLVLDRKACCMHYRRHDGDLCASCPKQKDAVRFERMKQELIDDA
ncbi:siderophore ferric iron reductase [Marinobacter nanhaiticus D15-8W]|uniref:Siderophore ferric iron reductase n=1 Tax=Marinobacter nanhaiticus D15-8W TaxID=626887 RepID=N6WU50_9GAMM|nr:siderophore ferric iron reductase [Marinobacter nanhaiticus]ENO15066.2 siderophore ferric iron reductase [Marinobacter nanhaiticus D15-8W]